MSTAWGRILFLDLGRVTGWASGDPADKFPQSGTITLGKPGASSSDQYGTLLLWLLRQCQGTDAPRMICFEAPIAHLIKNQSGKTKRMLLGYPAIVEAAASASNIREIREAEISDIRRNLLGRGIKRSEDAKSVVMAHIKMLGHKFEDNNAADAISGWLYACTTVDQKAGLRVTPLFGPNL